MEGAGGQNFRVFRSFLSVIREIAFFVVDHKVLTKARRTDSSKTLFLQHLPFTEWEYR